MTQLHSKLQSLEELEQSHEGLTDAPKAAFEYAHSLGKHEKIIALMDLLEVTPGFESFLEHGLADDLENLFILESALAVDLLTRVCDSTQKKQGRLSLQLLGSAPLDESVEAGAFLPSKGDSVLPFSDLRNFLEGHQFQVIGELSEFVTWNRKNGVYSQAIQPLIEHICLIESTESWPLLFEKNKTSRLQGWTIVSRNGMTLHSTTLRGGSLKTSDVFGILRRKRQIEALRLQSTEAVALFQQHESQVFSLQEALTLARTQRQTVQLEIQALDLQKAADDRDLRQAERSLQEARAQLSAITQEMQLFQLQAEQARKEHVFIEDEIHALMQSRSEWEAQIVDEAHILDQKSKALQEQNEKLQEIRIQDAALRERFLRLKRDREATQSLLHDRERRLQEIDRVLERISREQTQFSSTESELEEGVAELTQSLIQERERFLMVKTRIEALNAQMNDQLEKMKTLRQQTDGADGKTAQSTQVALEIEKLSGDQAHLIANLEEKYGIGCLQRLENLDSSLESPQLWNEALQESPENKVEAERILSEEVDRLRERMRRLGEVNLMAIEEFEALKKRADYLNHEKSDLDQSYLNLQEAIEHINKTSVERFKKAFEAIAEKFERLFPIVFGGGQAQLSLVYPEDSTDLLEAGIDILAQPPGKKVTNITLLSGGEKALTAVSLIFAIFMVKPSPFCVLDEVDAPLDDANIGKFNALLKEMSVKSQFILITHNKKTMELNDTLYGVTMEEPGVSKMVSIEMQ